jgi:hypothetical protein
MEDAKGCLFSLKSQKVMQSIPLGGWGGLEIIANPCKVPIFPPADVMKATADETANLMNMEFEDEVQVDQDPTEAYKRLVGEWRRKVEFGWHYGRNCDEKRATRYPRNRKPEASTASATVSILWEGAKTKGVIANTISVIGLAHLRA